VNHKTPGRLAKTIFVSLLLIVLLASLLAISETEKGENYKLTLTGSKTWTLSYGIGDASGLAKVGSSPYQISLDQSLAVDIVGEALSVLTISAHFNDKEPASMQTLTINLDTKHLKGVLGDFSLTGKQAFAVYNKKLKGLRLDYMRDGTTLTGVVSQIEGISESQTFIGSTAHAQVLYAASQPGTPWIAQPYRTNIAGLYAFSLSSPFITDFSIVNLTLVAGDPLRALLSQYSIGYLYDDISATPSAELKGDSFAVVGDDSQTLVLRSEPSALLRKRLQDAIKAYNKEHNLAGADRKVYPFTTGSQYERAFLDSLAMQATIDVDEDSYPITSGTQHRFYDLGKKNIKHGSVSVEVSLGGGTFRPITDPEFTMYKVTTYDSVGIIELDFPNGFFDDAKSAVRVSFDYNVSGDMFNLGLSVVPGSEKVYLNGKLLVRDTDYAIDYELGLLTLLVQVKESDNIRVDYERSRGGLGSSTEYARNFYGTMLTLPVSEAITLDLSLLRAADSVGASADKERLRTMPNTHTVSGVVGTINLDGFNAQFTAGYNNNVFPFDDNMRLNMPNEITSILTSGDYTLVASLNGLSVYKGGKWTAYSAASGLTGSRIYAMVSDEEHIFFGTSAGLSVLSLVGEAPFDQVENWMRYYLEDGLPNVAIHSLLLDDGTLYIGTEGGLAAVPMDLLDDRASYTAYTSDAFSTIYALAVSGGKLYVGTDRGLFTLDSDSGTLTSVPEASEARINALVASDTDLYIASDDGLAVMSAISGGTNWIFQGGPVYSVSFDEGKIYYGSNDGLYRENILAPATSGRSITAISILGDGTLWAGSRADSDYRLEVWHIGDTTETFSNSDLLIDGRDNSRFRDIIASDHTDKGILARASFNRSAENYSLSGSFESVQPTFTTIGRLSRSDSTGWSLNGNFHIADGIELVASHSFYQVDHASDHPRDTMQNNASLSIDLGIHADLSISQGLVNDDFFKAGFDSDTLTYALSLSDSLLSDALSLSLGWTDTLRGGIAGSSNPRENRLSASVGWQMTPEIKINGSWARPMSFSPNKTSGSERWNLTGDVRHAFSGLGTTFTYTVDGSRALTEKSTRITQTAKLDLRPNKFSLSSVDLTPRFTLGGNDKGGTITLNGQANMRATVSGFSAQATLGRDLSGLGEDREQTTDRISLSLAYSGIPDLRPNISFTQNASNVTYRNESRGSISRTLTGSLTWSPKDGRRDTLRISARGSSGSRQDGNLTVTVNNSYTFSADPFPEETLYQPIGVRIDLDGSYASRSETPDINLSLKTSADLTISKTWQTSLSASYLTGTKSDGKMYNSLLFELFVAARF